MNRASTRRVTRLCASWVVLCTASIWPLAAHGADSARVATEVGAAGIFEDVQYLTGRKLDDRLDAYSSLGVHWVRFQLIWDNVQHTDATTYEWRYYDALVHGIVSRGMTPLGVIGTAPAWARPATCEEPTCAPRVPDEFARFAAAAAARYAAVGMHHWEIWNEPNMAAFWKPHPDPSVYTALLRASYSAIKRADPRALVVSGGLASVGTTGDASGPLTIDPVDFLAAAYANGIAGSFDALGAHPYTFPALPGRSAFGWRALSGDAGRTLRGLMLQYGDSSKAIWATEFGAPTARTDGGVSDAEQARMVTTAHAMWRRFPWAGPLIWYSYRDAGTDPGNREHFFGLVRADGARKPAYFAFQRLARAANRKLIVRRAAVADARSATVSRWPNRLESSFPPGSPLRNSKPA